MEQIGGALFRGLVEVDEASIPCRSKEDDLTANSRGRNHLGKVALIGAVEIGEEGRPGRARLAVLPDYSGEKIGAFVRGAVAPKSGLLTDGLPAYWALAGEYDHQPKVVGKMAAHVMMPWAHLRAHLDEFA
ncbi:transposase [Dankookia sp. P2]|uniref:transposase n=1 Tax=Dankookia sp. P2 TaxID=3423955 RepID=UPI003D6746F6